MFIINFKKMILVYNYLQIIRLHKIMSKKILNTFLPIFLFSSLILPIFAQQIDTSLLSNLSPEQIQKAKELYLNNNNNSGIGLESFDSEKKDLNDSLYNEESTVKALSEKDKGLDMELALALKNKPVIKKFGYDFFNSMPTSISAVGDLPLPNDYRISLKDQLTIMLSGSKEIVFDLRVKLDGTILFPEIGSLSVAGDTFEAVKEKITTLVNQSYIGVSVNVSIKNLSAKKITIVGAVKTPGTYLVNPFTTITSSLAYSGGVEEIGTLRNIKLIKSNGDIFNFDLYDLLVNGDRSDDLTLDAGDTILIGAANQFVNLVGSVKRPMLYEVSPKDNLEDIINFGLGFKNTSNLSNISLSVLNLADSSIEQIQVTDLNTDLKDVISVTVYDYNSEYLSGVNISGAIEKPGFYDLKEFNNLEDVINAMNFINVYPFLGVLENFDIDNLKRSITLFNINDPSTYKDISLTQNSKIHFLELLKPKEYLNIEELEIQPQFKSIVDISDESKKLIQSYSLSIQHKDGNFLMPVVGYFSVVSFIEMLGLDMSYVDLKATFISPVDDFILNQSYTAMKFIASKYSTLKFRSLINNLIKVDIDGAINYPGQYTIPPNSTIEDLYNQLGGFKEVANLDAVIFKRLSIKKNQIKAIKQSQKSLNDAILANNIKNNDSSLDPSIIASLNLEIDDDNLGRISGDFKPNSSGARNTILRDGDSIFVPVKSNTITVLGDVLNPSSFVFDSNLTINDAINQSGGVKKTADSKNIYIIHADGLVDRKRKNLFSGSNKLKPGDTIVVPIKIETRDQNFRTIVSISQLLADLAFSAVALDNLQQSD